MARLLVIEDDYANLVLSQYLLEQAGHTVLTALTGKGGLAIAALERPALIVCDIHLPGMDGIEVIRRVKTDPVLRTIPWSPSPC